MIWSRYKDLEEASYLWTAVSTQSECHWLSWSRSTRKLCNFKTPLRCTCTSIYRGFQEQMIEHSALNGRKVSDWLRLCHMIGGQSSSLSLLLRLNKRYSFWVHLFHHLALASLELRRKPTHAVHKERGHLAVAWHSPPGH